MERTYGGNNVMTVLVDDRFSTDSGEFHSLGKWFVGSHRPYLHPAQDHHSSRENGYGLAASSGPHATYPSPRDMLLPHLEYANQLASLGGPGYVPLRAAPIQL